MELDEWIGEIRKGFQIRESAWCWDTCTAEMFLSNVSMLGQVWFELILLVGLWDGLTQSEGMFTVSGDLILFGTLMDCIASSVGGLWYMGDWRFFKAHSIFKLFNKQSCCNIACTFRSISRKKWVAFYGMITQRGWKCRCCSIYAETQGRGQGKHNRWALCT